jgi:hypothetical protein
MTVTEHFSEIAMTAADDPASIRGRQARNLSRCPLSAADANHVAQSDGSGFCSVPVEVGDLRALVVWEPPDSTVELRVSNIAHESGTHHNRGCWSSITATFGQLPVTESVVLPPLVGLRL